MHGFGGRLADFIGARHHPRQNADAIREDHQTFGATFPQLTGEKIAVVLQNIGQGDQVGGMAVHDHPVFAAGQFDALAVRQEVCRQLGGRDGILRQAPQDMVSRAVAVDLHHAEVSGRVELDVTEEFAGAGDDKRLVGQGWHRLAEGDIARLGVEIRRVRFDIRFIQTQRQVAAVAFVPAFQPGVGGGFDHALDEPGVDNGLHSLVFPVDSVRG